MAEWTCESCVYYPPSSFGGKPCWLCNTNDPLLNRYEKREEPVTTNADRIRAMSDEELAEFIGGIYTLGRDQWGDYDPCVVIDQNVKIRDNDDMLNWLREPVGGEPTE